MTTPLLISCQTGRIKISICMHFSCSFLFLLLSIPPDQMIRSILFWVQPSVCLSTILNLVCNFWFIFFSYSYLVCMFLWSNSNIKDQHLLTLTWGHGVSYTHLVTALNWIFRALPFVDCFHIHNLLAVKPVPYLMFIPSSLLFDFC